MPNDEIGCHMIKERASLFRLARNQSSINRSMPTSTAGNVQLNSNLMTTAENLEVSSDATFDQLTATVSTTVADNTNATVYFQSFIVIIGVVGTVANALVLFALCAAKQLNNLKHVNVLFINQMSADLFSCVMLVVTFSFNVSNIYLVGPTGYWLCMIVISENLLNIGLNSSILNLAAITVERYLMIVHPIWHKNKFRSWMIYVSVGFIWSSTFVSSMATFIPTSIVVDGVCLAGVTFASFEAKFGFGIWNFVSYYAIEALIFFYCYSHILVVIHRQMRVKPAPSNSSTTASVTASGKINGPGKVAQHQQQSMTSSELNAIVTMIVLTVLFVVSWSPINIYVLVLTSTTSLDLMNNGFYATLFIAFLNICVNPFIYAAKYDVVRSQLQKMFGCKKSFSEPTAISVARNSAHSSLKTPVCKRSYPGQQNNAKVNEITV